MNLVQNTDSVHLKKTLKKPGMLFYLGCFNNERIMDIM
uniref:Uncharacterized protein n=2 Tax=Anguilla anguilla TaxID=7936 RepID=A0A0E9SM88_ANGAN